MDELTPRPRLPEDPAYWDAFAERVLGASASELRRYRRGETSWWTAVGELAPVLAGGAIAAGLAGWLLLPVPRPAPDGGPADLVARTLSPGDAVARALLDESVAPPIGALLGMRED
jgi:hypothetical protein